MRSSAIAEIKMDEPKAENRMNGRPCVDGKDGKAFQQQTQFSTGVWKRFLSFRTKGIFFLKVARCHHAGVAQLLPLRGKIHTQTTLWFGMAG